MPSFDFLHAHFDVLSAANSVLLIGLILFLGSLGGLIFKKLRIPQVVGYIVMGIAIGSSGARFIGPDVIASLDAVSGFSLSLIGLLIGSELRIPVIRKYGRQFTGILILESVVPFFIVALLVFGLSMALGRDWASSLALALLLGAISSATAPAATTDVLAENRAKGPLSTILIGIVAMDDAVALLLFAVASTIAAGLVGESAPSLASQCLLIIYSTLGSCLVGALVGFLLSLLLQRVRNDDGRVLALSLGAVMVLAGACAHFGLNTILAAMAMGFFIVNFAKARARGLFALVDRFTPPVYVLFFVLVGAKLDIRSVSLYFGLIAVVYVIGRTLGKSVGSTLGAAITKAPASVQKYLKWCLLSQAGVAIGLSIQAGQSFPKTLGPTIMLVVTATTFLVQLIGPVCVRYGVDKAGECGLDVTDQDLLRQSSVADLLQTQAAEPLVGETASFAEVVECFGRRRSLACPVRSAKGGLYGVICIDDLKEALLLGELSAGILACDIASPPQLTCNSETGLDEARRALSEAGVDAAPVVDKGGALIGLIDQHSIDDFLRGKILDLRRREKALDA